MITINSYYQELTSNSSNSSNTVAKNLGDFVNKTKANGGYYLGRYEASEGSDKKVKSQVDKAPWVRITQPDAATQAREMYNSSFVDSDLVNSYSWDTAIVFIQKYNGNSNYANKRSVNASKVNTGKAGDEVCNIHDMASNCREWSTEYCTGMSLNYYCTMRGGLYDNSRYYTAYHYELERTWRSGDLTFRVALYLK